MYFLFVALFRFLPSLFFSCLLWIVSTVIAGGVFLLILFFLVYFLGSYIFCVYSFSGCTAILAYILNKLWQFLVTSLPDLHPTKLAWNHTDPSCIQKFTRLLQRVAFPAPSSSSFLQYLPNSEMWCLPNCGPFNAQRVNSSRSYQHYTSVTALVSSKPNSALSSDAWISVLEEVWRILPWAF